MQSGYAKKCITQLLALLGCTPYGRAGEVGAFNTGLVGAMHLQDLPITKV